MFMPFPRVTVNKGNNLLWAIQKATLEKRLNFIARLGTIFLYLTLNIPIPYSVKNVKIFPYLFL